jgi:hypothetical protein
MAVKISTIEQIPSNLLLRLDSHKNEFIKLECYDQIWAIDALYQIAIELNEVCLREGIFGYHYTRADKDEITHQGLLALSGEEHRKKFLERYGHRFSPEQREWICERWKNCFTPANNKVRDHRVWFNFTLVALAGLGAEYLLTYYGGEVIYAPICDNLEIGNVLKTIGQPMIIECVLNPAELTTFSEHPWGKVWLSSYHLKVNPNAHQFDADAYKQDSIDPTQINSIQVLEPPFKYRKIDCD